MFSGKSGHDQPSRLCCLHVCIVVHSLLWTLSEGLGAMLLHAWAYTVEEYTLQGKSDGDLPNMCL